MTVQEPTPDAAQARSAYLRARLEELLAESAWALDDHDYERYARFFTEDAIYEVGGQLLRGRAEIVRRFADRVGDRTTRHLCSGLRITALTDRAWEVRSIWLSFAGEGSPPIDRVIPYQVADFRDEVIEQPPHFRIRSRKITSIFREPHLAPRH